MLCGKRLLITLAAALALAAPASAITGGSVDTTHTSVGVVVADNGELCSGFLVSASTFITAAHCFVGAGPVVQLSFGSPFSGALAIGIAAPDPAFDPKSSKDTHDLAVVHIVQWAPGYTPPTNYLQLPAAGSLDQKSLRSQVVTDVGYGVTDAAATSIDHVRRFALSNVTNVKPTELRLAQNPGGVCFGDSGGPHILGNVALAVTSTGNKVCNGQSLNYRLDSPSARAFLVSQGVTVP
jgi:hypothetical protein